MSETVLRKFSLPAELEQRIREVLDRRFGLKLEDAKTLAGFIQKMSDYYIENPEGQTPWAERWCQIAQLVYYMPLNFLRMRAVLREGTRFDFFKDVDSLVDFGAGLGPVSLALEELAPGRRIEFIERSVDAQNLARELGLKFETVKNPEAMKKSLLAFSYSLTELPSLPAWALDFQNLIIVEPSTRQDGRKLLGVRKDLLRQGYLMWAPCPHQDACPLLEKNPHDWCHDRIHFDRPAWWLEIEKHLPFQNPTLTFSYLIASKRKPPVHEGKVRLVGDLMKEKGKSRQMICRGPEREFFSWLDRDGAAPEWPRGTLLKEPGEVKVAGSELRPQKPLISL